MKGFTLVELLTVVAIVGIVAAILFLNVGEARDRAEADCATFAARTIDRVPARCLSKFGIKSVTN